MQKAQQDVQQAVEELKNYGQSLVEEVKNTKIDPVELGISCATAFFLSLALYLSTKGKEDSFITFGVVIYALITGLVSFALQKKQIKDQFPLLVTVFAFLRLVFEIKPISVLVLSLSPVLVNAVVQSIKEHLDKNGVKIPKAVN